MTDIHPDLRTQRNAIRDEAYRRAASWLTVLPREWRPLDALARQIAPALGREYARLAPGGAGLDPTGAAGRKLLARAVLNRFLFEGSCDTHTGGDGRKTFARVGSVVTDRTRLPDPDGPPSLGGVAVALRPLTARHRRRVAAINAEAGNPWCLADPMDVAACPAGGGVVAVVGKTVVGYAVFGVHLESKGITVGVERVAVAAAWQRRGIGTILVQAVESLGERKGAGRSPVGPVLVCAVVPEPCLPAQVLLRGLGYAMFSETLIVPGMFGGVGGYGFCRPAGWQLRRQVRVAA